MTRKEIVLGIIIFVIFFLTWGTISYIEQNYSRKGVVKNVTNNIVTVEDSCGYLWTFEDETNINKGTSIKLKMHTNNTSGNIKDDYITGYTIIDE